MEQQRGICSFTPGGSAGCGTGVSTGQPTMRLCITSTTGSPVELTVPLGETVEGLRTHISHKLRLQTNRIVLLFRDRQLTAGKLVDLGVADGSKLTLVPAIEAGSACSTARAERTIMDVLEGLPEVKISDFLSGRSPLTINLGVGAQTMYVQLQLTAQNVADLRAGGSSELQTDLPAAAMTSPPNPCTNTPGSTSPVSQTSKSSVSTSSIQLSSQRHKTSFNSAAPPSYSLTTAPPHEAFTPRSTHTSPSVLSTPSSPSGCPHPSCPAPTATPVCPPAPTGSIPGPHSPVPASTFTESNVHASSTSELCKQPGAVIESLVSHSPGVFSGTFSGSLAPCSQTGISHSRRGFGIILQILQDLLRAAFLHQGAQPAPPHLRCPNMNPPPGPLLTAEQPSKAKSKTLVTKRAEHSKTQGEESPPSCSSTHENQTLHCKLERLQHLMLQRRLRRRTRRNSQTSHPYQHSHHRP
ncbi:midnolin [Notothenia coriiceps]|uniref:Midnolin n=1 Tax=Notothenia coriiceps TaxID=8208 RepID=A0A6I9NE62_9TELE|nr:PREDICTED: midnolin [Notothenia coriiceps]